MKCFPVISSFLLVCLFFSCQQKSPTSTVTTLELTDMVSDKSRTFNINDISTDIRLIPLETSDDLLIKNISKVLLHKDFMVIAYDNNCSLFDYNGNHIRTIGSRGQGPNEYIRLENVFMEDDKIYIFDGTKIVAFTLEGEPVLSFKTPALRDNIAMINKDLFVGYVPNISGNQETRLKFFNGSGELTDSIPYTVKYENPGGIVTIYYDESSFFRSGDKLYMKERFNDTIFTISPDNTLSACYALSLGEYSAAPKLRYNMYDLKSNPYKGKEILNLLGISSRYVLLSWFSHVVIWDKKEEIMHYGKILYNDKEKTLFDKDFFTPRCMSGDGKILISHETVMDTENEDNPTIILVTLKE